MNRLDFLFKAKILGTDKWIEGQLLQTKYNALIVTGVYHMMTDTTCEVDHVYEVDPETICRYTGYTDKNKKKIFEGDEVVSEKRFYTNDKAVVQWLDKRCGFFYVVDTIGTDIISRDPYQSAYKINSLKVEVVGNINDKKTK